jgi:alpha-beta hydrolase superfamily lysophospholipase
MTRQDVSFEVSGDRCAAWFYPSTHVAGHEETPVIVMAHGLSGTRRDGLGPFAERFAAIGVAAVLFDHRGFGDSGGTPDLFDPERQLEDWCGAITFARALPEVNPERVVTFGSSMGAGNALAAAAADLRIAAVIGQVPFIDLPRQAFSSRSAVKLRIALAAIAGRHLPAVGQPDQAAFINAPESERGWRHVVSIGEDSRWRNRVSARWLVGRPFRPARHASTLHCPWLVCVGESDQVAAPSVAIEAARSAPLGELRTYPGVDHFDIYDGPEHELVVADEIDFLRRHLLNH